MRIERPDEKRWLLGVGILSAVSWVRFLSTGSPKVDENYPSEGVGMLLFVGLLLGWSLLLNGWRGLLDTPSNNPRRLAFAGIAAASVMLPMISNDLYSLLAYGSLAAHGADVYTNPGSLTESAWYPWVGQLWDQTVCVYGPTTLLGVMPAAAVGPNPWLAIAILRIVWLAPVVLIMEASFRSMRDAPRFHTMVWLNPLWIVEGPGQLHGDLLGMVAIVGGMLLQRNSQPIASWATYTAATLGKYSFAFTGPWFWLVGAPDRRRRLLRIPAMAGVLAILGVVFFVPFWRGPATIFQPIASLARMNPGGSITEVVGEAVHLLRHGEIAPPDLPVHVAVALDRANKGETWFIVSLILRLVTLGVIGRALSVMMRKPYDEARIALGTGVIVIAAITLAAHRFQSWYLLAALPFFGIHSTRTWQRWWVAVVTVSVPVSFINVLPKTAILLPLWGALSTAGLIVVFLSSFTARFLRFEQPEPAHPGALSAATAQEGPSWPQASS